MTNSKKLQELFGETYAVSDYAPIPELVVDRNGGRVDLSTDYWRLNDPDDAPLINWNLFPISNPIVKYAAQLYVAHLIETVAPGTVVTSFADVSMLAHSYDRSLNGAEVEEIEVELSRLVARHIEFQRARGSVQRLHNLRLWYLWCSDQGLPGFSTEFAIALDDMIIGGDERGVAVRTHDPFQGSLKPVELSALRAALRAHEDKDSIIEGIALIWLHLALGCNVRNVVLLREEDLVIRVLENAVDPGENKSYVLRVPRIKKRGIRPRQEFRERPLNPEIGRMLERLIAYNHANRLVEPGYAQPLFVSPDLRKTILGDIREWGRHRSSGMLRRLMQETVRKLNVISPVTGKPLVLNPRRLRRTFSTNMVLQGCPPRILADLLDHSDLQHVMVYYESTGEFVDRLNRAVAVELGPKVGMFLGEVVKTTESDVELSRRILAPPAMHRLSTIGRCDKNSICGLAPPLSCYTCRKFKALKDADHEGVLQTVLDMRQKRKESVKDPNDRIAVQLDDTILAIGNVIAKIQEIK